MEALLSSSQSGDQLLEELLKDNRKISNGATIRSMPLGFLPTIQDVIHNGIVNASLTHDTVEGKASSIFIGLLTFHAYRHPVQDVYEFLESVLPHLPEDLRAPFLEMIRLSRLESADWANMEFDMFGQSFQGVPCRALETGAAVLYVLERSRRHPDVLVPMGMYLGGETGAVVSLSLAIAALSESAPNLPEAYWKGLDNSPNPEGKNFKADYAAALGLEMKREFGLLSPRRAKRPVIWNPFEPRHGKVFALHPSLGEGEVVGATCTDDGMIKVAFSGEAAISIERKRVVLSTDRAPYEVALKQRMTVHQYCSVSASAMLLPHFLSRSDADFFMEHLSQATGVAKDRLRHGISRINFTVNQDFGKKAIPALQALQDQLGLDPLSFALRMLVGERARALVVPGGKNKINKSSSPVFGTEGHNGPQLKVEKALDRILTVDVVREFLLQRPWKEWLREKTIGSGGPDIVQARGAYYPEYYPQGADKPNDLSDLYRCFRAGHAEAVKEVIGLFRDPIDAWMRSSHRKGPGLLVPMIGKAPLREVANAFSHPSIFPWLPRPSDYGEGVEGKRSFQKWTLLSNALRLDSACVESLRGKSVLLLDDNITDGVTFMKAKKDMMDEGALEVGLVSLTRTFRSPRE